jgi:tetratricopeptide (TPR) repeat protein
VTGSQTSSVAAAGPLVASESWPVRAGSVPLLSDRFSARPETIPDLVGALDRAGAAVLVSAASGEADTGWLRVRGKTQLAAFYAESRWRSRAIDLLVWIDASSRAAILAGFVAAAEAVSGTRMTGTAQSTALSFLSWLRQTRRPWLIVFDDLADGTLLQDLWPAGLSGQIVLTVPGRKAVAELGQLLLLDVGPFSRREAMSYLVARLSSDPDQRRGAMDLIEDLCGDPLALAQATAVIASSRMTCEDYRDRFHRRRPELGLAGQDPQLAAAVTWTLAVDRADQMLPGGTAHACLAFAALLDGHGIPDSVFMSAAAGRYIAGDRVPLAQAQERCRAALLCLEQAGLLAVDRDGDLGIVRMGTVLQQAVRAATPPEMRDQAGDAAAAALLEQWPEARELACVPHGLRASAESLRLATAGLLWHNGCHPLLFLAGQSLDAAQLTGPAVEYWSELAGVADRLFGPGHPDSMELVARLVAAYVADGRSGSAITWYQRLLVAWASAYPPHQAGVLAARVSLGRGLVAAGLASEAVGVLSAALEDCERALGSDHPESQRARDELAAAYTAAGELDEAIRLLRRALGDRERSAGALNPATITVRGNLAAAYLADGRIKDAISQYKKAVSDAEKSLGADEPETIRMRGSLAAAYHAAGRMAIAMQAYEQVHAASVRALGADHPDTLAAGVRLADGYCAVGRIGDATRLYEEVIARSELVLPPAHPLTQSARDSLATLTG